jgi:hypothetical protein
MKLNFQCGQDFITGWKNYDMNPVNAEIQQFDFRNFQQLGIKDNTVEEIRLNTSLELVHFSQIGNLFTQFYNALQVGGSLYLQGIHAEQLANTLAYGNISIEEFNQVVYGHPKLPHRSLYTLNLTENIMGQIGFKIKQKGIIGQAFYIRITK